MLGNKGLFNTLLVVSLAVVFLTGETRASGEGGFHPGGGVPVEKSGYTTSMLANGMVVLYGSARSLHAEPLLWNPQRRGWKRLEHAPECPYSHSRHTATALPNNRLLIAGGRCAVPKFLDDPSPESPHVRLSIWNALGGQWEAAPALTTARAAHAAAVLVDGSVLLIGGEQMPPSAAVVTLRSVERFHDGRIEAAAPLSVPRAWHSATTLSNGKVLVVGGQGGDGKALAGVELWDAASAVWRAAPAMAMARYGHAATLLDDGRVMVSGGIGSAGEPIATVEIFDPETNRWTPGVSMLYRVAGHVASLLSNGDVLVAGGRTLKEAPMPLAMHWVKARSAWVPAGIIDSGVSGDVPLDTGLGLQAWPDGGARLFAAANVLRWQPATQDGSVAPPYGQRSGFSLTVLGDGRVMMAGGRNGNVFHDWTEIYDPARGLFSPSGRLTLARSQHTAIALDNGGVVVAGGWVRRDEAPGRPAANSPETWDPVSGRWRPIEAIRFEWQDWVSLGKLADGRILFLASRELFDDRPDGPLAYRAWLWDPQSDALTRLEVPLKPRAKAALAILPDGRVLVVGGKQRQSGAEHWQEIAAPGGELWDVHGGTVKPLLVPQDWYAEAPRTLVLRNGDVLLTDEVQLNPYNQRRPLLYRWQSRTGEWQRLPIPERSGWPITEAADGTLMTVSEHLPTGAAAWIAQPVSILLDPLLLDLPGLGMMAFSRSAPYVAAFDDGVRRWHIRTLNSRVPNWREARLVEMADGKVMAIARNMGGHTAGNPVFIWNPADDSWQYSGHLQRNYGGASAAVALASGRIVHVGQLGDGQLACETTRPGSVSWEACGVFSNSVARDASSRIALGRLGDGRVALITEREQAWLFQESNPWWSESRLEWHIEDLGQGAPVRSNSDLARLQDPANGQWIEANALGAIFYQVATGVGGPRLLWNPERKEWSYIFDKRSDGMRPNAQLLPDGCAISGPPFYLFDRNTRRVVGLPDPGTGLQPGDSSMLVLRDGTVLVAGDAAVGGSGFFRGKATCAGFAADGDDAKIIPAFYQEQALVVPAAPAAPAAVSERSQGFGLDTYRWIALALLLPIVLYGAIRFILQPLFHGVFPAAKRNGTLGREQPAPRLGNRSRRVIGYGLAALIIVPMLGNVLSSRRMEKGDTCLDDVAACVDARTGILAAVDLPAGSRNAPPAIPCRFVGIWQSSQLQSRRMHIRLTDDGRYQAEQNTDGVRPIEVDRGYWMVQGDAMVWRTLRSPGMDPDVNPIIEESETGFVLRERNGSLSRFQRLEALPPGKCSP